MICFDRSPARDLLKFSKRQYVVVNVQQRSLLLA